MHIYVKNALGTAATVLFCASVVFLLYRIVDISGVQALQKDAIQYGNAQYNPIDGQFQWINHKAN